MDGRTDGRTERQGQYGSIKKENIRIDLPEEQDTIAYKIMLSRADGFILK